MSNDYYTKTGNPQANSAGASSLIRAEFTSIEAMADKLPPLTGNNDEVVVVNSTGTGLTSTPAATLDAATIHAATSKATPVDADEIPLVDSESSNVLKKLTWANLKATVKTYYDAVTSTLTNKSIDLTNNTLTGTTAQFNTALSDGDFATLAGTETLTNKSLTAPALEDARFTSSGVSAAITITNTGTENSLLVEDSASTDSTPFVIDASGKVIVGGPTAIQSIGIYPNIQGFGITGNSGHAELLSGFFNDATSAGQLHLGKSRAATQTLGTIVQSGDRLGSIQFVGDDGSTSMIRGASILAEVDGTPGTNDMPGRLLFSTTADGASAPTERLRIASDGKQTTTGYVKVDNSTANAAFTITNTGAGNSFVVEDSASTDSTSFVIDASGNAVVGDAAPLLGPGSATSKFSVNGINPFTGINYGAAGASDGVTMAIGATRAASLGSFSKALDGDTLGYFSYMGDNGSAFVNSVILQSLVEGTPTSSVVPSRFVIRTQRGGQLTVTTAVRTSNVVTITTSATCAQIYSVGDSVTIAGVTDATFNGTFTITKIPTSTTFTYAQTAGDASSSGGTASVSPASTSQRFRLGQSGDLQLGGGTNSPAYGLYLTRNIGGAATAAGAYLTGIVQADVTSAAYGFRSSLQVAADAAGIPNVVHFAAVPGTFSAVPIAQMGFQSPATLTGANQNYSFNSGVVAGTDYTITQVALATNVATITTSVAHALGVGSLVEIRLSTVTAGSFTVGGSYVIASVGTTDFTLIGAASNAVGTTFTATGVGTGTGTATLSSASVFNTNLNVTVTSVPTSTTFTFAKTNADITAVNIGGAVFNHSRFGIYTGSASNYLGGRTKILNATADDALRIVNTGTGNSLVVEDSSDPDGTPFVVNTNGNVIVGSMTSQDVGGGNGSGMFQINTTSGYNAVFGRWSNDSLGPYLNFYKSRATAVGTRTVAQNGDTLGYLLFSGEDGATSVNGALIVAAVDGTPGTNSMPGRLIFSTSDTATTGNPKERMRIDSVGAVGIGGTAAAATNLRVVKSMTGAITSYGIVQDPTIQSDVTNIAYVNLSYPATAAAAFTLANLHHYSAGQNTIGAGSAITNQYGFSASSNMTGATNNYGFHSNIPSGTGRWNFYAAGTAANYFAGETTVNSGLTIGRTAVSAPAATDGNVFSGTYTPTLTNTTNVAASTAYACQYMRVGNVITVSGRVDIDATATGTVVLGVTLPIASAFTQPQQAGGTFSNYNAGISDNGSVYADATNDRFAFKYEAVSVANNSFFFNVTYQVL